MRTLVTLFWLVFLGTLAAARAEFVKLSGDLTIHYRVAGEGNRIVLLVPGWTMSSAVFERQLGHFAGSKTFKLIAIDPRSQGLSAHTLEGNFYEQHGRDLNDFIKALDLKDIVLGGWSNGGFDILAYVNQFGSANLKGLIMLDAAPKGSGADNSAGSKEWVWFRKDDSDQYIEYFTQGSLLDRQKLNNEFAKWMVDSATPEYLAWMSGMTNQTGDGVAALLNESSAYQNYDADLKGLDGKVALLYFVHEGWEAVDNWSKANTPSATIVKFGKHLSFWEHPEKFNAALDEFLSKFK